ncbi:MAG: hAT transposon family protein [Pseudomonadota bacterium]
MDLSVEADGLLRKVRKPEFRFIVLFVKELLSILAPANKMLQSRNMDLNTATDIVMLVVESVRKLRSDSKFKHIIDSDFVDMSSYRASKKRRIIPNTTALNDSIVLETLPAHSSTSVSVSDIESDMRRLFFRIIDRTITELESRFCFSNTALLKSLSCLTSKTNLLDKEMLAPLAKLCSIDLQRNGDEIETARAFLLQKIPGSSFETLDKIVPILFEFREAFPCAYRLYASALTIGASTSTCEASFSTLTRIITPYRRSMLHERKVNLALLSFESQFTNSIDEEDFTKRFNNVKNRRLQLW